MEKLKIDGVLESVKHDPLFHSYRKELYDYIMNIVALKYCNLLVVYKIHLHMCIFLSFGDSGGKESACSAGHPSSILGSGRSPSKGNGNPLQYSCLENSMDRGAWWLQSMGSQRVGHDCVTNT